MNKNEIILKHGFNVRKDLADRNIKLILTYPFIEKYIETLPDVNNPEYVNLIFEANNWGL